MSYRRGRGAHHVAARRNAFQRGLRARTWVSRTGVDAWVEAREVREVWDLFRGVRWPW